MKKNNLEIAKIIGEPFDPHMPWTSAFDIEEVFICSEVFSMKKRKCLECEDRFECVTNKKDFIYHYDVLKDGWEK